MRSQGGLPPSFATPVVPEAPSAALPLAPLCCSLHGQCRLAPLAAFLARLLRRSEAPPESLSRGTQTVWAPACPQCRG